MNKYVIATHNLIAGELTQTIVEAEGEREALYGYLLKLMHPHTPEVQLDVEDILQYLFDCDQPTSIIALDPTPKSNSIDAWSIEVNQLAHEKGWYDSIDYEAHARMATLAIAASSKLLPETESLRKEGLLCSRIHIDVWDTKLTTPQLYSIARIWLIVSELFEAIEQITQGTESFWRDTTDSKPEGMGIELADAFIRLMDFCKEAKIPIEQYVQLKHEYNKTRPVRHGGKKV
jgi:NTP pyrophosphatase (non-canonical NTP hydrolase)